MKIPHEFPSERSGGCACLSRPADDGPERSVPPAPPTETYILRYEDRWFGIEKSVTFEAEDVAAALALMEHEPIGSWAELRRNGTLVCRRGRTPAGDADYWTVD